VEENKWRALRYGTGGKLIDFGMRTERPFQELMKEFVEFCGEPLDHFGTGQYMDTIMKIAAEGSSAHRQIEVYERTGDTKAVVDWLINETMQGM
jgi:carboxylate-amine ligase